MSASLRLLSVNIEYTKHLETVLPFVEKMKPDVLCVQEILKRDVPLFEAVVGKGIYAGMAQGEFGGVQDTLGLALFSRFPITAHAVTYYSGDGNLEEFDRSTLESKRASMHHLLLVCDIDKEDTMFRTGVTHFTWTPDGKADDLQRQKLPLLLSALERSGELVFCGDFNAPRGGEIFSAIAAKYKDNVPAHYTTSIDGSLHRAGPLPHMVDGLFSTPEYTVGDVTMLCGVSDHCALSATVIKS